MEITQNGEVRFLTFGTIQVPIYPRVTESVDHVKKLGTDYHELIIRDAGVTVPDGMDEGKLLLLAMSFVQNGWYLANDNQVPENIQKNHDARLVEFASLAETQAKLPPPEPKVRYHKTPGTKLYAVVPDAQVEGVITKFSGSRKAVYEALASAGAEARLTAAQVLERAKLSCTKAFKGKDGGVMQTNYQLKCLEELGVVRQLPEQAEIPRSSKEETDGE